MTLDPFTFNRDANEFCCWRLKRESNFFKNKKLFIWKYFQTYRKVTRMVQKNTCLPFIQIHLLLTFYIT